MNIQILGSGCTTCSKLHQLVEEIVREVGHNDTVEYLSGAAGTQKIIELGLISSPVLTVDNQVVMTGFNPDKQKVKEKIYGHI